MSTDYVYNEVIGGDRLVVEDLTDADYSYAEDLELYEVRLKGSRVGRFDEWSEVVSVLEEEKEENVFV